MQCVEHNDDSERLGYSAWHDKAAKSARRGMKQRQCAECRRFFWPWEMRSTPTRTAGT